MTLSDIVEKTGVPRTTLHSWGIVSTTPPDQLVRIFSFQSERIREAGMLKIEKANRIDAVIYVVALKESLLQESIDEV